MRKAPTVRPGEPHLTTKPAWEGALKFSLITVPVKAFSAVTAGKSDVAFNLLHKECHSRIRYKKMCPLHGEVEQRDIVSGYEYTKGKFVVLDPAELGRLRAENDRSINIDAFVDADSIDPLFFAGRSYYLTPAGKNAQKPYVVLQESLKSMHRYGVAELVLSGREHLAVVRSVDEVMTLSLLNYVQEVRPASQFEEELTEQKISAEERRLAQTLIEASTREDFDLTAYQDDYAAKVQKLIESKVKGKRMVAAPTSEPPAVINLMDALRRSIDQAERPKKTERRKRTKRKPVERSSRPKPAAKRRRTG
jgi:DNA end-binding protein Ku